MRIARIVLVIIAVVCLGVALSYPIRYRQAQEKNDSDMSELALMRQKARQSLAGQTQGGTDASDGASPGEPRTGQQAEPGGEPEAGTGHQAGPGGEPEAGTGQQAAPGEESGTANAADEGNTGTGGGSAVPREDSPGHVAGADAPASQSGNAGAPEGRADAPDDTTPASGGAVNAAGGEDSAVAPTPEPAPTPVPTPTPEPTLEPNYWDLAKYYATTPTPSPTPGPQAVEGPTVAPTPTPDRSIRNGPLPYALKEKVVLDKGAMLPELKEIYALNNDLVGWINIPDTVIDYPVVQAEDGEYYLSHDFYGEENINGQIILDVLCDPYTPSYNLVVSGHHMKNGTMFGGLPEYRNKSYWERHKILELDTLMEHKFYVIFACFYSADYDEDETGFRYNAIIDYKMDADRWLEEIIENQLYDTGIEREFGDEFVTLTTCDRARHRNGRFVVVGRKIREGETIE